MPCSVFVQPVELEKAELASIMKTAELCQFHSLLLLFLLLIDFAAAMSSAELPKCRAESITALLHLVAVKQANNRIFYGKSLQVTSENRAWFFVVTFFHNRERMLRYC